MQLSLNTDLRGEVFPIVEKIVSAQIASRIAQKDSTVWGPEAQAEASIRLGWVTSAKDSVDLVPEIIALKREFERIGVDRFVLCGMGGSSLAPEVITKVSGKELFILDSTAPEQVMSAIRDLNRTAIIVSSKSGSTVETDSQRRAFEAAFREAGIDPINRVVIVTDPGSPLEKASKEAGYRVYNADPNVGGRYSALTAFGLVPSGLAGCDIASLLRSAQEAAVSLEADSIDNPAIWLAAVLAGRSSVDKFLIEADPLPAFADWVEQLVAESTGKNSKGVLPVAITKSAPELSQELSDSVVIRFGELTHDVAFSGNLGELFLLWEYATAIGGWLLGINPFDQPNVESAKVAARSLLDSPQPDSAVNFVDRGIGVRARGFEVIGSTVEAAVEQLLDATKPNSYFAIHSYLPSTTYPQILQLRDVIAKRIQRPVTFGWGPRFLHSTGQYHKGGPKQGVFLQLTYLPQADLEIPGRPFTFAELIRAQANGDANVLAAEQLPVLSLELSNPLEALEILVRVIQS
jgi:glucose-6-phosphate isomerase